MGAAIKNICVVIVPVLEHLINATQSMKFHFFLLTGLKSQRMVSVCKYRLEGAYIVYWMENGALQGKRIHVHPVPQYYVIFILEYIFVTWEMLISLLGPKSNRCSIGVG